MPPINQTDPNFVFKPDPPIANPIHFPFPLPSPLGPLEALVGTWSGTGFNTIWRPHFPDSPQDRFLELNTTTETLVFSAISGAIPNRGLLQQDMNMFGLTYMQQIAESPSGNGLHIEPGIWAVVPATTAPAAPPTVVRMASIPHGTTMLAQGTATVTNGPPPIEPTNITPFNGAQQFNFPEVNLATPSAFRSVSGPGVTQALVNNPNSFLAAGLAGKTVTSTTTLHVTTTATPVPGGGTSNTDFLHAGNANASKVEAIFWIESIKDPAGGPDTLQLQYTQTVELDFNGLSWPHITVGTLHKTIPVHIPIPVPVIHPDVPLNVATTPNVPRPPQPDPGPEATAG